MEGRKGCQSLRLRCHCSVQTAVLPPPMPSPSLGTRDTQETPKPSWSMWTQHGLDLMPGKGFTALNHRLSVGHPGVGTLRFHGESVSERGTSRQGTIPEVG